MANLAVITDEQAELINGGRRCHRRSGGIKLVFPNLTTLTINGAVILSNSGDFTFNYNPPA